MMHRSKEIDLISTLQSSTLGSSEPSRFIHQITNELVQDVEIKDWKLPTPKQIAPALKVPNSADITKAVQNRLLKGISPSAFNTFIMCPLDFYHKYILGLREPEEVMEGVENTVFGTAIHEVLEKIYTPFVGREIDKTAIEEAIAQIPTMITSEFEKELPAESLRSGANLLAVEASKHYLTRFLKWELDQIKALSSSGRSIKIIALERKMKKEIDLNGIPITLKGTADRIDQIGDCIRIIDYKTGKVESKDLSFKNTPEEIFDPKKIKLLQILCYAYLALDELEINGELEIGMISLRRIKSGFIPAMKGKEVIRKEEIPELLETVLQQVVNDMLNEDLVWEHKKEAIFCDYCLNN